jgi:excisionase family DNA binding protein
MDIPNTPNPLLTTDQAADILKVKPSTLVNWRCTKRVALPFVRVGRAVRYRQSEIQAFIERGGAV